MGYSQDLSSDLLDLNLGFQRKTPPMCPMKCQKETYPFSLTLGLSEDTIKTSKESELNRRAVSDGSEARFSSTTTTTHSTVSSFSNFDPYQRCVKRERDLGGEEFETERVSPRLSDEDEEGSPRKKLRLTKEQSALLEESFKEHSTLNPNQKQALARQLNLRPRQVEVWFQNRRARTKLKQTEVEYELLKRCCQSLTEENRRLQKELSDLKSLKLPVYMKIPAATLTMCPSCERMVSGGVSGDGSKPSCIISTKTHLYNPFPHSSSTAC